MWHTETGKSKGFAFINFSSFEASDKPEDAALKQIGLGDLRILDLPMEREAMNGQFLCNRAAIKADGFSR
uniref:RRM domain-containing protein n=1 Tax=Steinernema glaseri TaxID=37863 RepID=A0A1I8AWC6_9BILA